MSDGVLVLDLREPAADGKAKWWGKPGAAKFYVPTGRPTDEPWTQDVCWKGALTKEFSIAKNKKEDIESGTDIDAILRSKDFLRHQGASRDSQRTGLNTRQNSAGGKSMHSTIPSRRSPTKGPSPTKGRDSARGQTKHVLQGLLADNQDLKHEFKELRKIFVSTEKRIQQLEQYTE